MEYGDIYLQAQRNKYDCLLFGMLFYSEHLVVKVDYPQKELANNYFFELADLDDTLYPLSSGLAKACRNNIEGIYMHGCYLFLGLLLFVFWDFRVSDFIMMLFSRLYG